MCLSAVKLGCDSWFVSDPAEPQLISSSITAISVPLAFALEQVLYEGKVAAAVSCQPIRADLGLLLTMQRFK